MLIEKLTNNGLQSVQQAGPKITDKIESLSAASSCNAQKLANFLDGLSVINSTLVKNNTQDIQILDETTELLSGYTKKTLNSDLSNLAPENMVLVHMTDYFPENGIIKSAYNASKEATGCGIPRFKVHFSVNHAVEAHNGGNWNDKKFAVLMPMDETFSATPKENIVGGQIIDFFIQGDVKIPPNSIILQYGNKVPKGKMTVQKPEGLNGVRLISTPNKNLHSFANQTVKKMGYSPLSKSIIQEDKMQYPFSDEIIPYSEDVINAWRDFTSKYNLHNIAHTYSPYGKSEQLIQAIQVLKYSDDSWSYYNYQDLNAMQVNDYIYRNVILPIIEDLEPETQGDYQKCFLAIIEQIKQELPKGKKTDYDIDKLADIIRISKTPSEAIKRTEEVFGFDLTIVPPDGLKNGMDKRMAAQYINSLLPVTKGQKRRIENLAKAQGFDI